MMLGGANGTITLSLAFSIPQTVGHHFALRQGLILIAAVEILLSLIVPVIILPRFASLKRQTQSPIYLVTAHAGGGH